MNVNDLVAIDVHTHAEEPCGTHADDGYDEFQAAMAVYFKPAATSADHRRRPPPTTASARSAR